WLRIQVCGWIGRIAVSVVNPSDFPVFNLSGAMPGLNNELVMRVDIAKDDHFDVGISEWEYLANRGHPAAEQTIEALLDVLTANLVEVLVWMIGASIAPGIDGLSILGLHGSYKCVPAKTRGRRVCGLRTIWPRRALRGSGLLDQFYIGIIASGKKLVGEKI